MNVNGLMSPPQTEKSMSTTATPPRIILGDKNARILCVADIRGDCESCSLLDHLPSLITREGEERKIYLVESSWLTYTVHELNRMIREHNATAVIHTGDFGFLTADSLERMGDK